MSAYYSENDEFAAAWLRNLIAENLIAPGDVDERSIEDVQPDDLQGYDQCHFFAGIGGWSLALRLAGWPDDRPVWTGSCPCQPFSAAGKQLGTDDPRHLWPVWCGNLIAVRHPPVVFGEQVANAAQWLRLVRGDLEALGYAVGAIPMEAASADADHFRDRYWFVADHDVERSGEERLQPGGQQRRPGREPQDNDRPMANLPGERGNGLENTAGTDGCSSVEIRGDRNVVDLARLGWGDWWTEHEFRRRGFSAAVASIDDRQYVECPDGKWRRLPPPRVRWLGNGIPARVGKLRAFGNAIDPRPAAAFIGAYMDLR